MQEWDAATTMICFDFDGTLVDENSRIHPADVEVLANERLVSLVPATGRPLHAVRRTFERHGLFVDVPIPFPMVLENGAAVYAENEVLRSQTSLDPDLQDTLMRAVLSSEGVSFLLFGLDEVRTLRPNEMLMGLVRRFDTDARPFEPESGKLLCKVAAISDDPEVLRDFDARTSGLVLERTYSLPNVLELTTVGVNKGRGLRTLLDSSPEHSDAEVVAVGDGENDLALFDLASLTFAPENSPPAIRVRADRLLDVRKRGLLAPILEELKLRRGQSA